MFLVFGFRLPFSGVASLLMGQAIAPAQARHGRETVIFTVGR